jgi:hypothetical protein
MGQPEKAVPVIERMREFNPKAGLHQGFVAVVYAHLGRMKEAREAVDYLVNRGENLRTMMYHACWKNPEVVDFTAKNYLKAGLPGDPGDYYKPTIFYDKNKLTGKEIRDLVFGQTVSGFDFVSGKEWWIERTKDGQAAFRDAEDSHSGKSWIKGDELCNQWKNLYGGYKDCMRIYPNPGGTIEKKNQYIGIASYTFVPFSSVD